MGITKIFQENKIRLKHLASATTIAVNNFLTSLILINFRNLFRKTELTSKSL